MPSADYAVYAPARPYFDLVRGALGDLVDGAHFFDIVDERIDDEVRYAFPGWPRVIHGRSALMEQFLAYCANIALDAADHLIVNRVDGGAVIIIEYELRGRINATGAAYENRFASVIELAGRKIVRWRDYMDSLAAWTILTAGRS